MPQSWSNVGKRWANIVPTDPLICFYAAFVSVAFCLEMKPEKKCLQVWIRSPGKAFHWDIPCPTEFKLQRSIRIHGWEIVCWQCYEYPWLSLSYCALLVHWARFWREWINAFPAPNKNEFVRGPMVLWVVIEYILKQWCQYCSQKKNKPYTQPIEKNDPFKHHGPGCFEPRIPLARSSIFFEDLFKTPIYVYIKKSSSLDLSEISTSYIYIYMCVCVFINPWLHVYIYM